MIVKWQESSSTGGPPLTQKPLTRFPLTRFLAYVRVSGGISAIRGPQYSPTNTVTSPKMHVRWGPSVQNIFAIKIIESIWT